METFPQFVSQFPIELDRLFRRTVAVHETLNVETGEQCGYEVSQVLLGEVRQHCQAVINVPDGLIEEITVVVTTVTGWLVCLEVFAHSLHPLLHDRKPFTPHCEIRQATQDEIQEILLFLIITRETQFNAIDHIGKAVVKICQRSSIDRPIR